MINLKDLLPTLLLLFVLMVFSLATRAENMLTEVGFQSEAGKITLFQERFVESFPNGSSVDSVEVISAGDVYYVSRKGNTGKDNCFEQRAPLYDAYGNILATGGGESLGPVFLASLSAVDIFYCKDVGCKDYVLSLGIADTPFFENAQCELSEELPRECACHVDFKLGSAAYTHVSNKLCKTVIDTDILHLYYWVVSGGDYGPLPHSTHR